MTLIIEALFKEHELPKQKIYWPNVFVWLLAIFSWPIILFLASLFTN